MPTYLLFFYRTVFYKMRLIFSEFTKEITTRVLFRYKYAVSLFGSCALCIAVPQPCLPQKFKRKTIGLLNKGPVMQKVFQAMSQRHVSHYGDVTMGMIASQITSLAIVFSTVYLDTDQRKHQSFASLAFVWGIHREPVNSPHKWSVTRKMFPFHDVIMVISRMLRKICTRFVVLCFVVVILRVPCGFFVIYLPIAETKMSSF